MTSVPSRQPLQRTPVTSAVSRKTAGSPGQPSRAAHSPSQAGRAGSGRGEATLASWPPYGSTSSAEPCMDSTAIGREGRVDAEAPLEVVEQVGGEAQLVDPELDPAGAGPERPAGTGRSCR